uniref:protein phosphatase methylesterase 1-like isoform X1 n=1 Tax=Myxine glutinosa TaxID=7769 RepID=UPI00358F810C
MSLHKKLRMRPRPPTPMDPMKSHGIGRKRDYTPMTWDHYFETIQDVAVGDDGNGDTFRVYCSGSAGPVLVLLHGGGHSALSWAVFTATITSCLNCRVVAIDLRGHGDTHVENSEDLSAQTMAKDVGLVLKALYGSEAPPIVLVGHSMGGAIAVHTTAANEVSSVIALVVIDIVEGTALDALHSMQTFLRNRPKCFKSLEHAIEWSVKSGQIRNLESAKVSMAGQVQRCENPMVAFGLSTSLAEGIKEEVEEEEVEEEEETVAPPNTNELVQPQSQPETGTSVNYSWRIDLSRTERFWEGWFRGLSSLFLSCPVPKMLLLAGVDRLDKDLTIGQMQGKFQMQVLPQCGHAVHEDAPEKVADAIAAFMIRHRMTEAKGDFKPVLPGC